MTGPLPEVLLRIAGAVAADGGWGVRLALEAALREAAPFDAGEIVFVRAGGDHVHLPLGSDDGPLLGPDLVAHVLSHGAPYRIDDGPDVEPFPETRERLQARALRSLLVLPFRFETAGPPALSGVLGVARAHGWAYVGASLPWLVPLAGMAGLAADRALQLSALAERARALEVVSPWGPSAVAGHRSAVEEARRSAEHRQRERDHARAEAEAARAEALTVRAGAEDGAELLRKARNAVHEGERRADAAEERLREAERARDDWAQQAASLRVQLREQKGELQSLARAAAGARETAAAAADLAEAREVRNRELEALVRKLEAELRQAREEGASLPEAPADPPSRPADARRRR
jgi:hypothetical protein